MRHYDRLGVFRPAGVDEETGYRWYAADQLPRARLITRLRAAAVPLDATRVRGDLHRLPHLRDDPDESAGSEARELS